MYTAYKLSLGMATLLLGMGVLPHGQEEWIPLPEVLEDFQIQRTVLQEAHPGIYHLPVFLSPGRPVSHETVY